MKKNHEAYLYAIPELGIKHKPSAVKQPGKIMRWFWWFWFAGVLTYKEHLPKRKKGIPHKQRVAYGWR